MESTITTDDSNVNTLTNDVLKKSSLLINVSEELNEENKNNRLYCFLSQGLHHAYTLSHTVKTLISLHSTLKLPIKPQCMLVLFRYAELMKVIELTYHRHAMAIAPYFNSLMQFHSQRLLKNIVVAKVKKIWRIDWKKRFFRRNELLQQTINDSMIFKSMFLLR